MASALHRGRMETLVALALSFVPVVVLVSIRIGVVIAAMPPPFGSMSPIPIRAGLGVLIALTVALPHADAVADVPLSALGMGRAAVGEMFVGAVIGMTVRVVLAAAEIAGTFAGFSMGLGFASSVDPMLGEAAIPSSRLLGVFAALLFLVLQGHHIVLEALAASLYLAPPGDAFGAIAHEGVVDIGSEMLAHGLRIAAPVVATMFIVQIGTGLVAKAAPRVHVFVLSFAVAAAAGILTMFVAAPTIADAISAEIGRLPQALVASMGGR